VLSVVVFGQVQLTLYVFNSTGAAACGACLKCGKRGKPPLLIHYALEQQPVGDRDKRANIDSDQGGPNGEI
jgi:hypothetical protein